MLAVIHGARACFTHTNRSADMLWRRWGLMREHRAAAVRRLMTWFYAGKAWPRGSLPDVLERSAPGWHFVLDDVFEHRVASGLPETTKSLRGCCPKDLSAYRTGAVE